MRTLLAITVLAWMTASCSDEAPDRIPTGAELELLLSSVSGDGQEAAPGESLSLPLVVQVKDVWGNGIAGQRVVWTVTYGAGTFGAPSPTVTGTDGQTMTSFTPATARVEIRAAIEGRFGSNVLFRTVPRLIGSYERVSPSLGCNQTVCEVLVFYADNGFGLRYGKGPEFAGTFARNGSVVELLFKEPRWRATAAIRGDSLFVKYNDEAGLSDFEDGTFRLTQGELPPS
jgi:hypothetical protein